MLTWHITDISVLLVMLIWFFADTYIDIVVLFIWYIGTVVMLIFSHRQEFWHHGVVGDQGGEGRVVLQESLEEEQMFMIVFFYHNLV